MIANLLLLIDDIAGVLDDVAVLAKAATRKTAGVLGDDLALNAQQVSGVRPERELPVVWAVAKGSLRNKAILVPAALAISAFAPWAVTPLLMLGGLYLCYEGFEKIAHKFTTHGPEEAQHERALAEALIDPAKDMVEIERARIRGAIRTDFILSAEIIVIALGTAAAATFTTRVVVLVGVALLMTVGVYGFVALIVKLDDIGLHLHRRPDAASQAAGRAILRFAPWLMRALSFAGTAAMFMVGGGILLHGIPSLHHEAEALAQRAGTIAGVGPVLEILTTAALGLVAGAIAGALALIVVEIARRLWAAARPRAPDRPA